MDRHTLVGEVASPANARATVDAQRRGVRSLSAAIFAELACSRA